MPICKACGEDNKHSVHGLCRRCYRKQYYAKYRETHREKLMETSQKWHRAHGTKSASENKQCTVFLGVHIAEQVLSKVFKVVQKMPYGHKGFDFICSKGKKIDVKSTCTRSYTGWSDRWTFNIVKNKTADYFLCLAFDNREDLNPLHIWLIPGHIINNVTGTSISESTLPKWDEYKLDINKVTACCNSIKRDTDAYADKQETKDDNKHNGQ